MLNWGSISAARQDALLREMKRFIDEQIAAGSDIELPSMYRKDAIGEDISDLPGLFQAR